MKNITINEIGLCISESLKAGKKNVLFISHTLLYENVLTWADEHPEYYLCRETPSPLYNQTESGRLIKDENCMIIANATLENANSENSIWFLHALSEKCINNFDGFLDIIKNRFYVNKFSDGTVQKISLEKLPLFVAFTTNPDENDWASLDEKYYALFDEIYLVNE